MEESKWNNPESPDLRASITSEMHRFMANPIKQDLFRECQTIFKKTYQSRSSHQNATILKLIGKNQFLREASEAVSMDFMKGILRHAKIQYVNERQVILQEDQYLNYVVVVLDGKLGVQRNSLLLVESPAALANLELSNDQFLEKLTLQAKKEKQMHKKNPNSIKRKSSMPHSQYEFIPPILSEQEFHVASNNLERFVNVNEAYGGRERLNSKLNKNNIISMENSTLLIIEINFLFYWLHHALKVKMNQSIQIMKVIPAFEILEEEKMIDIIINMKIHKKKKGQFIYKQGDEAKSLYILIEGQIKLLKFTHLFMENPNDFYVDRKRLLSPEKQVAKSKNNPRKKEKDILPFANLETMYNYRPMNKTVELGVISSFGLLGEEESIYKRSRETTAMIDCLEASYYEIQFAKVLSIIGVKNVDKFLQVLEHSISTKLLYRQSQYAQKIDFLNRQHLNYFYEEGNSKQDSPRKYKLQKLNQKIFPQTGRKPQNTSEAFYTTFNFDKLITQRYSLSRERSRKEDKRTESTDQDSIMVQELNQAEEKIVGISHSWNPIKKKVQKEILVSKMINPHKQRITINEPLIDQQYFSEVAKEKKRINKQFRTVRLSLGKRGVSK